MAQPFVALAAALVLIGTSSVTAVPAPAPQESQNALSILCDALTTYTGTSVSIPAACTPSATTTTTGETTTTGTSTTTGAAAAGTTISAPEACASGAIPNESTQSCWGDMGLEDYVKGWWDDNKDNCDNTGADGSASFANCWYKIMVKPESPTNCDVLNTGTSCAKPNWQDFSGDNMEANFWVTWSIYNVNTWWTSMNDAISAAGANVEAVVGKVVTTLNPPEPPKTPTWEYVLDGLVFATSLWAEGSELFKAIVRTVPQTFALTTKVYPQGEVEGTVTEWADVEEQVSKFITKWADSVGEAVPLTANDVEAFARTAGAGEFTGATYDLSGLTKSTGLVLGTMMTSAACVATQYIITRTAGKSIADEQSQNDLWWDTDCGDGYNNGICGAFYYDGSDTYSLVSQQKWQKDTTELMQTLFLGDDPVADPKLFFSGSYSCSTTDDNKNGEAKPSLDSADPNNFSCVASNRVCTYDWDDDNGADNAPFTPDSQCSKDDLPSLFDFRCLAGSAYTASASGTCLPFSYFGPMIEKDDDDAKPCNDKCGGGNVGD